MNDIFLKEGKKLDTRFLFLYIVLAVIFGILIVNLINLQIVKGNEHLYLSSTIKTSEEVAIAARGLIYDRDDNLLVVNRPAFKLGLDLSELPTEKEKEVIETLSEILGIENKKLWKDYEKRIYNDGVRSSLSEIILLSDVSRDQAVSVSSRAAELPGIYVEIGTTREYKEDMTYAHILGYVQEVSAGELATGEYNVGDTVGSVGLEQYYDSALRGINGKSIIETNRNDETVRELIPVDALAGKSIKISIDTKMQEKMTESLAAGIEKNNADGGAAIIMDVTNGEILTSVSLPTYDPNKIVQGLSVSEYQSLSNDPRLPLYNRAISVAQPPGSTFKTLIGSVGLQEGAITPSTIFISEGCMEIVEGYEICEVGKVPHGKLNIYSATERSSNIYFVKTMFEFGIDKFNEYSDDFGLGQKTGIDLFGEQPGIMASKDVKMSLQGEPWYLGDSGNVAIGQGLTKVTPIQMVSWVSGIANDGAVYKPHLVTEIIDSDTGKVEVIEPEISHQFPIDPQHLGVIREGMHLVVNGPWGSAWPLKGVKSNPAAKTGSAEAPRKVGNTYELQGHSWISGFYPYDNPRYAFVVYMEFGGWGFNSAEVMRDFFDWYDVEYPS